MRRTEFGRMLEEASRGARTKLLNRWSRVQIPAPAPIFVTAPTQNSPREPALEVLKPNSDGHFAERR